MIRSHFPTHIHQIENGKNIVSVLNSNMNTMKRKTISNEFWSEQRKKNITDEKSSIENLSNELLYEIFDYLDGWDLYQAFVNLNHHFEQLVHSPFLRLKIKLCHWRTDDQFENNWKQMIDLHREQIFSMNLSIVPSTMDFLSFNHLQSLTLRYLEFNVCMSVLLKLRSLPCLVSLSISMISNLEYLHEIYRVILALPMVKYYKFSADASYIDPPLPMATREEYNLIEYLVIDHSCSFDELVILVSYTPQLRQLHVTDSLESMPKIRMMSPTALINLTHLTIFADNFVFDEIELFIKRMNFKLKVFVIRTSDDASFLHADRWEQLIIQYLPYLDEFCLLYQECIGEKYQYDIYHGKQNPFLTSFWIQRQWFFDIDIDDEYTTYSIQSYRKQWYDHFPENSSLKFSKLTGLLLSYENEDRLKFVAIKRALKIAQIYHLEITKEKLSIEKFIKTIELLPDLHTLTIHSLSLHQSKTLFSKTKNTGNITKVCLQQLNSVNDIDFLMTLCPAMIYFQVDHIENITIEFYLRFILKKIDHRSLRSLSFYHPTADDQLVKHLENMIINENLLVNYSIKRLFNQIRLQWI